MAIHHLVTNIKGLLVNRTPKQLDKLFDMKNGQAYLQLLDLLSKGHKYIGSENCKHFDPIEGCMCRFYDSEGNKKELCNRCNKNIKYDDSIYCIECNYEKTMTGY